MRTCKVVKFVSPAPSATRSSQEHSSLWFYSILIQETILFKMLNLQGYSLIPLLFKKV